MVFICVREGFVEAREIGGYITISGDDENSGLIWASSPEDGGDVSVANVRDGPGKNVVCVYDGCSTILGMMKSLKTA